MAFTPVTVRWQFAGPLGPDSGYVEFEPSIPMLDTVTGQEVAGVTRYTLDSSGWVNASAGFDLTANDDPGTEPRGTYWRATVHLDGAAIREYALLLYVSDAGTPVLATQRIATVAPSPFYQYVLLSDFLNHTRLIASDTVLGHVKIGSGITIDPDGTIHASTSGSGAYLPLAGGTMTGVIVHAGLIATGGNARGAGAIDLQLTRSAPTQVAAGLASILGAGRNNTVDPASQYTGVLAGTGNTVKGFNSVVVAGSGNTAQGTNSAVVAGQGNTAGLVGGTGGIVVGGLSGQASGSYAVVVGGQFGVASGIQSVVVGGDHGQAGGNQSAIVAGQQNLINFGSARSFIGSGFTNSVASQDTVIVGGRNNTANGSVSVISGGDTNLTTALYSMIPGGWQAVAGLTGQLATANGSFAVPGDAQQSILVARQHTTDATPGELFLDGGSRRLVIGDGHMVNVHLEVAARASDDSAYAAWNVIVVAVRPVGGAITLLGTPVVTDLVGAPAGWTFSVAADPAHQAITMAVQGGAGVTIHWFARITMAEVS